MKRVSYYEEQFNLPAKQTYKMILIQYKKRSSRESGSKKCLCKILDIYQMYSKSTERGLIHFISKAHGYFTSLFPLYAKIK